MIRIQIGRRRTRRGLRAWRGRIIFATGLLAWGVYVDPVTAVRIVVDVGWMAGFRWSQVFPWVYLAAVLVALYYAARLLPGVTIPRPTIPAWRRTPPQLADAIADRTGRKLELLVGWLLERDGCTNVRAGGGGGDLGKDASGVTAAGLRVVAQCKNYPGRTVGSPEVQTFNGTVRQVHHADVPLFVTTGSFTAPGLDFARQVGIVPVDGRLLGRWVAGKWSPVPQAVTYARVA